MRNAGHAPAGVSYHCSVSHLETFSLRGSTLLSTDFVKSLCLEVFLGYCRFLRVSFKDSVPCKNLWYLSESDFLRKKVIIIKKDV